MKAHRMAKVADEIAPLAEAPYTPKDDYEGEMAITQLKAMVEKANKIIPMLKPNSKLEAWVQSKITMAEDYMTSVYDYLKNTPDAIGEDVDVIGEMKMADPKLYDAARKSFPPIFAARLGRSTEWYNETINKMTRIMFDMWASQGGRMSMDQLARSAKVKLGLFGESTEVNEAPVMDMPVQSMRGYSPQQFENRFRDLMGMLGFSKALPIKKFGSSFWVSFTNMPKAKDFAMTLEKLLRRSVKSNMRLTRVIEIDPDDEAIQKGYVPSSTRAAVVVNMASVMESVLIDQGFQDLLESLNNFEIEGE